jgi:hypothetical protein
MEKKATIEEKQLIHDAVKELPLEKLMEFYFRLCMAEFSEKIFAEFRK